MVTKLKSKFIPRDYYTKLFKRLQNLRQKEMNVKDYIEEFHKLIIRVGHLEEDMENDLGGY